MSGPARQARGGQGQHGRPMAGPVVAIPAVQGVRRAVAAWPQDADRFVQSIGSECWAQRGSVDGALHHEGARLEERSISAQRVDGVAGRWPGCRFPSGAKTKVHALRGHALAAGVRPVQDRDQTHGVHQDGLARCWGCSCRGTNRSAAGYLASTSRKGGKSISDPPQRVQKHRYTPAAGGLRASCGQLCTRSGCLSTLSVKVIHPQRATYLDGHLPWSFYG
jgi:hypothetical protein